MRHLSSRIQIRHQFTLFQLMLGTEAASVCFVLHFIRIKQKYLEQELVFAEQLPNDERSDTNMTRFNE